MIDLYYWPTPNGWKVSIMLEEVGLPYRLFPVNLREGEHSRPAFAEVNPNQRVPAIVDRDPVPGTVCAPVTLAESGAILLYLAERTRRLLPREQGAHYEVVQWLMWQMSALGPTLGQLKHHRDIMGGKNEGATARFAAEAERLYRVMDRRLADREFLAGDYSIADIASWTFTTPYERESQTLDAFPNVARWSETMLARPAVRRGLDVGAPWRVGGFIDEHVKSVLLR